MTIQEMNERRQELGFSYKHLSELSGVPLGTVQKVLGGFTEHPRFETIKALETVLRESVPGTSGHYYRIPPGPADYVREATPAYGKGHKSGAGAGRTRGTNQTPVYIQKGNERIYPRQGTYTVADRDSLPDEIRTELIDGVLYEMAAPVRFHQFLVGQIFKRLDDFVLENDGPCVPLLSPSDVQLDNDEWTMVQPDIFVLCKEEQKTEETITRGAPDMVVEVLSPSTRNKDLYIKTAKYANAGVREYWVVDPRLERVIVHDFAHEGEIALYGFGAQVPVRIWDGRCVIDLGEIIGRWDRVFGKGAREDRPDR